jgi:HSP20 family protein
MDLYRIQPLHGRGRRVWAPWRETGEMQWALEQIRARAEAVVLAHEERASVDADLYDAGSAYVVRVDLPGVTAEQLLVTIENGVLTIEGHRRNGRPEEAVLLRGERRTGRLTRALRLPGGVDSAAATATLRSGVLEIVLPKAGATAPGKVAIDVVWHPGEPRNDDDAGRLTPRV